jgi:predicted Zn-dependent protease
MNARLTLAGFAILLSLLGCASAETLSFQEHNFAIELPQGWSRTDAPAPAVAAAKNADGQKILIVIAARMPNNERDTAVHSMSSAAKDSSKAKGWKIFSEQQVVINGIAFDIYHAQIPGGATMISWMTSAGNEIYSLQGINKAGDASADSEFQSIISSFRLLSPASINMPSYDRTSVAYRVGRLIGGPCVCLFLLGLFVVAAIGIVWLIRRRKTSGKEDMPK